MQPLQGRVQQAFLVCQTRMENILLQLNVKHVFPAVREQGPQKRPVTPSLAPAAAAHGVLSQPRQGHGEVPTHTGLASRASD